MKQSDPPLLGNLSNVKLPLKTCVVHCPVVNCGRRFGGDFGDTAFFSWRCPKCRFYHYGTISNGKFELAVTLRKPLNIHDMARKQSYNMMKPVSDKKTPVCACKGCRMKKTGYSTCIKEKPILNVS